MEPQGAGRALRRLARDGARLCRDRALPVGDARRLLEPDRDRRERLCAVLPGQLGLLRPVDLRALPRRRDPGDARIRAARAAPAPTRGRVCSDRGDLGRAPLLVLPVELRRARRRRAGGCDGGVALAGRCRRRSRRGRPPQRRLRDPAGAGEAAAGVAGGTQQRDERPSEPRHERDRDRCRPSRPGSGSRELQARVRRPHGAERTRAAQGGVALDSGDGCRGDGASGAATPRLARRCRARRGAPGRASKRCRSRRARRGAYAWRDRRAQLLLQRALRGPDDVGSARSRRADVRAPSGGSA